MKDWYARKNILSRGHLPFPSYLLDKKSMLVSTRNHFGLQTGELNSSHGSEDYDSYNVPGLDGKPCSDINEIAVYIHGAWTGLTAAKEQTARTMLSLDSNEYKVPVIGFSWDSNTATNPSGWSLAKSIANQNGAKLAKFIADFKTSCPDHNIRIIAHSLGAKIVESALLNLNKDQIMKKDSFDNIITSVHFLGAAISDRATSKNTQFGIAIDSTVNRFYNLYNPKDNVLTGAYLKIENENPLGLFGLKEGEPSPANYTEQNVMLEIPPYRKASGVYKPFADDTVYEWGNNHFGYIGFRDTDGKLKDDGAVNVIVADWRTHNKQE